MVEPYPNYQESGVDWLGRIPTSWALAPGRDLFQEVSDRNHPDEQLLSVTIQKGVIHQDELLADSSKKDASNLDKTSYKLVRPGDVAYNKMRAWQGAVGMSQHRGIVSPAYIVLSPQPRMRPEYAHYLLRIPAFATEAERWSYGITSDQWSLRPEHFRQIYFPVPPANHQTAIVRYLDHVDSRIQRLIAAKEQLIELLEEDKQALIHRAVTRGLDPNVPLKPSGVEWLGEVPTHWTLVPLKAVSRRVVTGSTPPTDEPRFVQEGEVPWFGPTALASPDSLGPPARMLATAAFAEGRARRVKAPAILVVIIGATAGRVGLLRSDGSTNQQITAFELDGSRVTPEFVMWHMQSASSQIRGTASTATIPIVNGSSLRRTPLALPPVSEQMAIVRHLAPVLDRHRDAAEGARRHISLLREYRSRLISRMVTGQLDVREAAAALPEDPEAADPRVDEQLEEAMAG